MTKFIYKAMLFFVLLAALHIVHGDDDDNDLDDHDIGPEDHDVGDDTEWTNILPSPDFYKTWASTRTFRVGDTLEFEFATGAHNVAIVDKAAYDACTKTETKNLITAGPATVALTALGPQYFICTIGQHCSLGQKLAINVVSANAPPTTPGVPASPSATPGTPASPSDTSGKTTPAAGDNAASSLSTATVLVILMSFAAGIFLC